MKISCFLNIHYDDYKGERKSVSIQCLCNSFLRNIFSSICDDDAEYAYTLKVNEKSDVYSFGVVLLELVTGKRPTDPSFGDHKDIVKWVTEAVASCQEQRNDADLSHLFDPRLSPSSQDYVEMFNVLNVALLCTAAFPMNRPSMRRVVELLQDRRDLSFLAAIGQINKESR